MKKIAIISHEKDESALYLYRKIIDKKLPVELLNLGNFSLDVFGTIQFDNINSISLRTPNGLLDADSIKSIWWRRPKGENKNSKKSLMQQYIDIETDIAINFIFKSLNNVVWVSEPDATRNANIKPRQLSIAKNLGFRIPMTCISNDPDAINSFLERHQSISLIMKPVGSAFVRLANDPKDKMRKNRTIYTRIIDKNILLNNSESIKVCPFILQEAIIKDFDVRVTVVGDDVFASEILVNTKGDSTLVDWRHYNSNIEYKKHSLPEEIEVLCKKIIKELGLNFGCIDLGFSKKEGYTFFEINPQGQWLPSEVIAGHQISNSLISLLRE